MPQNTKDKVDINQSVFSFVSFLPSQYKILNNPFLLFPIFLVMRERGI